MLSMGRAKKQKSFPTNQNCFQNIAPFPLSQFSFIEQNRIENYNINGINSNGYKLAVIPKGYRSVLIPNDSSQYPHPFPPKASMADSDSLRTNPELFTQKHIPRPQNAFLLYRTDKIHDIKKMFPKVKNDQISKTAGQLWKNESSEIKQLYFNKAKELKLQHGIMYPMYKFSPKRSKPVTKDKSNQENSSLDSIGMELTSNDSIQSDFEPYVKHSSNKKEPVLSNSPKSVNLTKSISCTSKYPMNTDNSHALLTKSSSIELLSSTNTSAYQCGRVNTDIIEGYHRQMPQIGTISQLDRSENSLNKNSSLTEQMKRYQASEMAMNFDSNILDYSKACPLSTNQAHIHSGSIFNFEAIPEHIPNSLPVMSQEQFLNQQFQFANMNLMFTLNGNYNSYALIDNPYMVHNPTGSYYRSGPSYMEPGNMNPFDYSMANLGNYN